MVAVPRLTFYVLRFCVCDVLQWGMEREMMNDELRTIFEQDQADRQGELHPEVGQRDRARRARVEELIAADELQTPEDYFHAAMVFQHGERLEHFLRAHELALKAAELGDPQPARWLAAPAYDRWLIYQGQRQKYGTQYIAEDGCWKLWDTDPTTTDEERAAWDVPSL